MAGDALESMNQDARGGNDILIGGSNSSSSGSSVANAIAGDSFDMNFFAHGGNDSLVGGNNYGSGDVVNNMTGDAFSMGGTGGNDTIAGGNNYGSGGVSNMMFGDSRTAMLADQQAGDDVLIAGIGLNVNNFMFGDALGGANFPGQDTFIFEDDKKTGLTVGTQNAIGDFQQGLDVIKFIGSLRMSKNSATLVSRPRRLAPIPTPSS
jgi:hypothetical protein